MYTIFKSIFCKEVRPVAGLEGSQWAWQTSKKSILAIVDLCFTSQFVSAGGPNFSQNESKSKHAEFKTLAVTK